MIKNANCEHLGRDISLSLGMFIWPPLTWHWVSIVSQTFERTQTILLCLHHFRTVHVFPLSGCVHLLTYVIICGTFLADFTLLCANFCRFYALKFYCTEIHENGGNTRARPTWLNHCKFKWLFFVKITVFTLKLPKWKKWWKIAKYHTQICLGPKFATNKYQVYSSMFLIFRYIHNIL